MSNIIYIATSLDGFIAGKDGRIDWLINFPNPEKSDYGFSPFLERIDGIIMGRKTFEVVAKFEDWPYNKPVFVLSGSLKELPSHLRDKAEIIHGNVAMILKDLENRGLANIYIDGGKTVQSFMNLDLIDELIISRIPVVLGAGIPLFAEMNQELEFNHISTEIFGNGIIKSRYLRKRTA